MGRTSFHALVVAAVVLVGCSTATTDQASPASPAADAASGTVGPAASPAPTARPTPVGADHLPDGFVRVTDVIPDALFEIRYAGEHNFLGRPVTGYTESECWLTNQAAAALRKVQRRVGAKGYTLKFYDCFRPQRAVDDFVSWAADARDTTTRAEFYPTLGKTELFAQGYIAGKSGHSRGSTVDVTLVPQGAGVSPKWTVGDRLVACTRPAGRRFADTGIDMGTGFDCFDPRASTADPTVSPRQAANRRRLVKAMARAGFTNLPQEWWHFTLADEPFPDTYFDAELTSGGRIDRGAPAAVRRRDGVGHSAAMSATSSKLDRN